MDVIQLHDDNRIAWDDAAQHYEDGEAEAIEFLRGGGRNFEEPELPYLDAMEGWCERAIHLQCAAGTDTLSLWNMGAGEVVGVDISPRMIASAKRRSDALGAPATWHCCDVLETPHELDETADLVYTGRGALCWVMDINAWARVVVRLLKPGGRLFLFEGHPLDWIWASESAELKLDPKYGDYFDRSVFDDQGWTAEYVGDLGKPKEEHAIKHERQWLIGDVMNALADAGMYFARMEEHATTFWDGFPNMPDEILTKLPHTYSLLMLKP